MSNTPQGPGWWQASDGRWYAPEEPTVVAEPTRATANVPPALASATVKSGGRWKSWQLATAALVSLFIGMAIGSGGGSKDTSPEDDVIDAAAKAETPATEPQASETTSAPETTAAPATTAKAVVTTPPPTPKQWVQVARLSGSSKKRGDVFQITSTQARLRYKSPSDGFFSVYIVEEGKSLEKEGGFPEVTCTEPCEDTTNLAVGKGSYYLEANSMGSYEVVVEEFR